MLSLSTPDIDPEYPPSKFEGNSELNFNEKGFDLSLTSDMVAGRIGQKEFFEFWKFELLASESILDSLSTGYVFPFTENPPPSCEKNNKSALNNKVFVKEQLQLWEKIGCTR